MLLKNIDDKSHIIKKLQNLLKHPKIFPSKKKEIQFQIYKLKVGWQNEKEAAYYIDTYYKDNPKMFVLHDLRLKYEDISVQIDHLLVFRTELVIFESKYFSQTLSYDWKNQVFNIKTKNGYKGIKDPIKQAERQALNLKRLLEKTKLKIFLPEIINYYVLVSPNAFFKTKMPDKVVKADKFIDKFREEDENIGILEGLSKMKTYLSFPIEKIKYGSEELMKLHKPVTYEDILRSLKLDWIEK